MSPTAALISIPTQTAFLSSEVLWFKSSKLRQLRDSAGCNACFPRVVRFCSGCGERPGTLVQTNWLSCSDSAILGFRLGPFPRVQSSKVAAGKGKASEKPRKRGSRSVSRKEMQEMTRRKRGKQEVGRYRTWAPALQRRGRKPTAGTLSTLPMTPILPAASASCPRKLFQQPKLLSV